MKPTNPMNDPHITGYMSGPFETLTVKAQSICALCREPFHYEVEETDEGDEPAEPPARCGDCEEQISGARPHLTWTVELTVDPIWVQDGFDLQTSEDVKDLLAQRLPHAWGHEIGGRVLQAPDPKRIAKLQGSFKLARNEDGECNGCGLSHDPQKQRCEG